MSIESKHYVADPSDIEALAKSIFASDGTSLTGRRTYLAALLGTLQDELESPPRKRSGQAPLLDDETCAAHLKAFEDVAKRFGDAVSRAARAAAPTPGDVHSLTAFARSSASTLRGYIRARNDVRVLAAGKVTKAMLAVPLTQRKPTAPAIKRKVVRLQEELIIAARVMLAGNSEEAHATLEPLLGELAQLLGLTSKPTKDSEIAEAEGRAWRTKTGMFVPVTLQ